MVYYNEFDKGAAAWLRELIRAGLLPAGDVDERDIREVKARELKGYKHCHFFAGIGGWPYALRLAEWPEDEEIWSQSLPCQPFSEAGEGEGFEDPRDLWSPWLDLVRERKPAVLVGEQVASAVRFGWLDRVYGDLEKEGYAVGAHVLGAHSVGAPHIRQRLWWVADTNGGNSGSREQRQQQKDSRDSFVADSNRVGRSEHVDEPGKRGSSKEKHSSECEVDCRRMADTERRGLLQRSGRSRKASCAIAKMGRRTRDEPESVRVVSGLGIAKSEGLEERTRDCGIPGTTMDTHAGGGFVGTGSWDSFEFIPCRDGKSRRVEPSIFPLADGVSARVVRLRGYGNAIVPELAAEFVKAYRAARAAV